MFKDTERSCLSNFLFFSLVPSSPLTSPCSLFLKLPWRKSGPAFQRRLLGRAVRRIHSFMLFQELPSCLLLFTDAESICFTLVNSMPSNLCFLSHKSTAIAMLGCELQFCSNKVLWDKHQRITGRGYFFLVFEQAALFNKENGIASKIWLQCRISAWGLPHATIVWLCRILLKVCSFLCGMYHVIIFLWPLLPWYLDTKTTIFRLGRTIVLLTLEFHYSLFLCYVTLCRHLSSAVARWTVWFDVVDVPFQI